MGINAHNINVIQPIGRFAPSPTGELHFGSLTTAIASYCHIKSLNGKWLLRIEDTDIQRCKPAFSELILKKLSALSLFWDDEIIYQSQRSDIYNSYINDILKPKIYACQCSRKQLKGSGMYPKNCLHKTLDFNQHKLRIQLPNECLSFNDGIQNIQYQNPQKTLGDMVIRRDKASLNMINYILAVSIDDGLQNISHIMRGLDILPLTSAQIAIMQMAGFIHADPHISKLDHPTTNQDNRACLNQNIKINSDIRHQSRHSNNQITPYWYHLPLVTNQQGQKLSKQNLAQPIDTSTEKKCSEMIAAALYFLQQPSVDMDTPQKMLEQSVSQWDNKFLLVSRNNQIME